ncbi:MAG: putative Ig domain-containing protein [Rhodanobacter sp.]
MTTLFGSEAIGFQLAELSTVFFDYMKRSIDRLEEQQKSGEITEQDFAREFGDAYSQCAELAHLFSRKFHDEGNEDLSTVCEAWASGFDRKVTLAEAVVIDPYAAGYFFQDVIGALSAFDDGAIIDETLGANSGKLLLAKGLGWADKTINAWAAFQDYLKGDTTDIAGLVAGIIVGDMVVTAGAVLIGATALEGLAVITAVVAVGAVSVVAAKGVGGAVNEFLEIFGGEDDEDAGDTVRRLLKDSNSVLLPHIGDKLHFGTSGSDVIYGTSGVKNDAVGGLGDDIIAGADLIDYLSGGGGNDDIDGGGGDDTLRGGSGDDTLVGGLGDDRLAGGLGLDIYKFSASDFLSGPTEDVISDEDGQGRIYFDGSSISGTGIGFDTIHDASFGTWLTSDEKFRLSVLGEGDNQALIIVHRASGSRIVVNHWKNGDLGIEIPDMDGVNPHNSAPLTGGDDLFGASSSNAGNDQIDGLAGNDGLDGGAGDDVIDGGFDDDLILGGSGNDQLSGSSGNDVILDGSELLNFRDWSDTAGSDGRSERQRVEDDMAQLGDAVLSRGKGWYIRLNGADGDGGFTIVTSEAATFLDPNASPGGDDVIDGGDGNDRIAAGEGDDRITGGAGNDIIDGGHDDDTISGGDGDDTISGDLFEDAVAHVDFTALVSDQARKNGNDVIDAGAGNDKVVGGGGNDVIYGGAGDDRLAGRGESRPVDSDDLDRDYIDGGSGADMITGDDGDDTLLGGDGNDIIRGDNASADTRNGNDKIYGGAGDDQLGGDGGDDVIYGDDGADLLIGDGPDIDGSLHGSDLLFGGAGNDTLMGYGGDDSLDGGDGDDVLVGDADETLLAPVYHGNDFLSGGAGNDELQGNGGDDVLDSGVGDDRLFGGSGNDVLNGDDGKDELAGGEGNDRLAGGAENDKLWGEAGDDELIGGEGDDELRGGAGKDTLSGGVGVDLLIGEDGDDTIDGGAGNDSLYGSAGADHLSGGDGDDYLDGDETAVPAAMHGNDTLDGGAGNDVIHGQGGDDVITGGDGDDLLFGDDYEKVFSGNDRVSGGAGNDVIVGGAGDDELLGDDGNDSLSGGEGDDQLTGGVGDDQLAGGTGNDTYHFERGFGTDRIFQLAGEDSGHDIIAFGSSITASDLSYQVEGDDLIISNASSGDVLGIRDYFGPGALLDITFANGSVLTRASLEQQLGWVTAVVSGNDDDVIEGTSGNDRLYGGGGNDVMSGGQGNDYLNGGDGDDQLNGGSGENTLEGGAGNDIYTVNLGSFETILGLADSDGGTDTIRFNAGLSQDLVTNYQISGDDLFVGFMISGNLTGAMLKGFLATTNGTHVIEFSDGTRLTADNFRSGDNNWTGTEADDVHVGTEANDTLNGGDGNDTLSGAGGNDYLVGGAGDDTLNGNDGDDILRGVVGSDTLNGGAGNDQLYGTGTSNLQGGAGDDRYYVYSSSDTYYSGADAVVENGSEGVDTVYADVYSYTLSANVENLVAIYDPTVWVMHYGNGSQEDLPRELVGNSLDNTISLASPSGFETHRGHIYLLDGGAGADTLIGSAANEIYVVDQLGDKVVETDTGSYQSFDTVRASISYTLAEDSNIEALELTGAGDISGWGNSGSNILDGSTSSGANVLYGGAGDDTYIVGANDSIVEVAGEGNDTVLIKGPGISGGTTFTLANYQNVEGLRLDNSVQGGNLLGDAGDNQLAGNGYHNVIHGGEGNDTLSGGEISGYGSSGRDDLYGDAGNDSLHASSGGADLYGGIGDDQLYGSAGADNFHYAIGDGTDVVHSSAGASLDRVVFSEEITPDMVSFSRDGATLIVQVGSDPNDQIHVADYWTTTDGDALSGGIDQLIFADGTIRKGGLDHLPYTNNPPVTVISNVDVQAVGDTPLSFALPQGMFSDATDDTVLLSLGAGAPAWLSLDPHTGLLTGTPPNGGQEAVLQVIAADSWGQTATATLRLSVSNVIHGSTGDDTMVGTSFRDDIYAGAGNDTLDGGGNTDRLFGGTGDDTYLIGDSNARIVENAGEGSDTVHARVNYEVGANVERLVLDADSQAVEGIGNNLANEISGNALNNWLDGSGGADTLTGGLGDDTYVVDNAGDLIVESAGEGTDTVRSFISWQLGDTLENLTLAGDAEIDGTGNAQDNVLSGNDGANRLEGGGGVDKLYGGYGDDYLVQETATDRIFEYEGEGNDTIERHFETNLVLDDNIENLVLGDAVVTGNGNDVDNVLIGNAAGNNLAGLDGDDGLYGLDGDDSMWGGNGQDSLYGGAGNDYLDGEASIDYLEGGAGDDVYVVGDTGDVVVEAAGGGTDQVQASSSYTLSDNIENLFLMDGAGAINGTGNALDNYLAGNDDNNVLNGMGGSDTMVAGGGDDLLIGGTGDDKYVFDATSGSDVVDNTGGGNDGIFFTNGVVRDRLSFGRDGDDLLIFVDAASTPSVRVTNHFLGGDAAIDYVQPDGGFMLTTAQINQIVAGSTGGQYDQVIEGTAAAEQLVGSAGKDLIKGLAGDDQLFGLAGDDTLQGGDGDDYLAGGGGSGSGSGADRLEGGAGSDTLSGEDGTNMLLGGAGDDSYVYGGGQDTIDNTDGGFDGVFFNDGITASQLGFSRDGDDLLITVDDNASSTVRVTNHFLGGDYAIDYVQPASGSMLDTAAINALVGGGSGDPGTPGELGNDSDYTTTVDGTAAGEQLLGTNGRDLIHGLGGNDTIFGFGGDDKFVGGDGDDYLSGGNGSFSGSGNDILIGGAGVDTLVGEDGNDLLLGGAGNDKYIWQAGSGSDVIDNTGGGTDWLFFNGVNRTRLSFHRSGDDLIVLVDGDEAQQVRVQNHFLGGDLAISYVQPSDGYAIPASQFGSLLTPLPAGFMAASFSPSSMSAMSLVPDAQAMAFGTNDAAYSVTDSTSSDDLLDKRGRLHAALWDWPSEKGSIHRESHVRSMDGVARFGEGVSVSREAQQLIEAMSRFNPVSGASESHEDSAWNSSTLTLSHVTDHPFKQRSMVSAL